VTRLRTVAIPAVLAVLSMPTTALAGPAYTTPVDSSDRWPLAKPEQEQIDGKALNALFAELVTDPHKDLKGIVILRHGKLVAEAYFNGDDANTLHDIRSATKSITAALMGIAIDRGIINSVDDSIADYLPGLPRDGKEKISIRNLLNMRSGLDADDGDPASRGNETRLDNSTDWMKSVYAVPMKRQPGTKYVYVSINAFLAGAIIENASRIRLDEFAKQNLFFPLGIARYEWRRVPIDRTTGQGNLSITARDEAALGQLFLQQGQYHDRQVVSRVWVEQCVAGQVPISADDPDTDYHGYMWYTKTETVGDRSIPVHLASGNGGNKIYVVPSLDMVVAITSSAYNQPYRHTRSHDILLKVLSATHRSRRPPNQDSCCFSRNELLVGLPTAERSEDRDHRTSSNCLLSRFARVVYARGTLMNALVRVASFAFHGG
jgi:CubicO group peptidase (beta-lactamase class C family)